MATASFPAPTCVDRPLAVRAAADRSDGEERRRAGNYPIARWWLRPLAGRLAASLAFTRVRPWHLTMCGLLAALCAATLAINAPAAMPWAGGFVLLYWFFDRADGQLARRQGTTSPRGAWLDANVDELADVGLHLAVAYAAMASGSTWAGPLVAAFLAGKYLLMYGLATEEALSHSCSAPREDASEGRRCSWVRAAYHLPGNADVRLHLLALALLTGWLTAELAFVAVYYNLRWLVRYGLVIRRCGGVPQ